MNLCLDGVKMYYNLFDSHSHSENSPDGEHSITYMAETAINKGLLGLAITDHCEIQDFDERDYDKRILLSAIGTAMSKSAFGRRLILAFGVEIAQISFDRKKAEELLAHHRFDFVIGSLHGLVNEGFDYYEADYTALSPQKLYDYNIKYYEEMAEMVRWGNLDVLGHLSLPLRYPKIKAGIDVDLTLYKEPIDEVLKLAAQNGKGIEINTSGLFNDLNDTLPPAWVIRRFKELGGEIVTIGSDAHCAEDLGRGVEHGMQIMADAGFEYFAFYRNREPVMLRII